MVPANAFTNASKRSSILSFSAAPSALPTRKIFLREFILCEARIIPNAVPVARPANTPKIALLVVISFIDWSIAKEGVGVEPRDDHNHGIANFSPSMKGMRKIIKAPGLKSFKEIRLPFTFQE
jgi:hypothetical protein